MLQLQQRDKYDKNVRSNIGLLVLVMSIQVVLEILFRLFLQLFIIGSRIVGSFWHQNRQSDNFQNFSKEVSNSVRSHLLPYTSPKIDTGHSCSPNDRAKYQN